MARSIVTKSLFNAAAGMTMLITGFASSIITARLLGPEANGLVAYAFWLTTTGTLIAGLGCDVLFARMLPQLAAKGYDARQRLGFAAFMAQFVVLVTLIILGLFLLLSQTSEHPIWSFGTPDVVIVTALLFLLQAIGTLTVHVLVGEQRPDIFLRLTLISAALQVPVTIYGALHYGAAGALAGYVASYLVMFLYAARLLLVKPDRCGAPVAELAKASLYISLGTIIESIFLNRIELAFLQHYMGIHTVGFYAIGLTLANLALQLPVQLSGALVPYYTELAHQHGGRKLPVHLFEDVIRILAYVTLPIAFGLAALATDLVRDIFGAEFASAGPVVALLGLSAPFSVFAAISTKYLFACGQEKPRTIIGFIGALIISLGCYFVVPGFGGEGAAAVRIVMLAAMCVLMVLRMNFDGSLLPMYASLAKIATAAAGCAVVAHGVATTISGVPGTAAAILSGALSYFLLLRLLRAVPPKDAGGLMTMAQRLPGRWALLAARFTMLIAGIRQQDPLH